MLTWSLSHSHAIPRPPVRLPASPRHRPPKLPYEPPSRAPSTIRSPRRPSIPFVGAPPLLQSLTITGSGIPNSSRLPFFPPSACSKPQRYRLTALAVPPAHDQAAPAASPTPTPAFATPRTTTTMSPSVVVGSASWICRSCGGGEGLLVCGGWVGGVVVGGRRGGGVVCGCASGGDSVVRGGRGSDVGVGAHGGREGLVAGGRGCEAAGFECVPLAVARYLVALEEVAASALWGTVVVAAVPEHNSLGAAAAPAESLVPAHGGGLFFG